MSSFEEYFQKLNYLGGNLQLSSKVKTFVDLELFFLESTLYLEKDNRIKQTILNWLVLFSPILSPSKIRRLSKSKPFNQKNLDLLVHFLIRNKKVKENWKILINKNSSPNIKFKENFTKYLKTKKFILKNVPEIRLRAEGRNQVVADIIAYCLKSKFKSLYELAKNIHSPKNRVNECYRQLTDFGLIPSTNLENKVY